MNRELDQLVEIFNAKQQQLADLENGIDELEAKIESHSPSETIYHDARSTLESMRQSSPTNYYAQNAVLLSPELRNVSGRGAEADASDSHSLSFDESPEKLRQGSPYLLRRTYFEESDPKSIHSTPRSKSTHYSVTLPSPLSSPLMQNSGLSEALVGVPKAVAIASPSGIFTTHRTATVARNTQSTANNRVAVGKSFNLRTTCDTSTPYNQVTRVASFIPESGYSGRMIEHPLNITHSKVVTPTRNNTPFISRSRFGYTDPTVRVLHY